MGRKFFTAFMPGKRSGGRQTAALFKQSFQFHSKLLPAPEPPRLFSLSSTNLWRRGLRRGGSHEGSWGGGFQQVHAEDFGTFMERRRVALLNKHLGARQNSSSGAIFLGELPDCLYGFHLYGGFFQKRKRATDGHR
jgi:hypothetical protein